MEMTRRILNVPLAQLLVKSVVKVSQIVHYVILGIMRLMEVRL